MAKVTFDTIYWGEIMRIFLLMVAFALPGLAFAEEFRAQDMRQMIETLGLDGRQSDAEVLTIAHNAFNSVGTLACRKNGFSCKSSIECCSYCMRNVCGGETYNKPDGASCKSSIECKSYCMNG